MADEADLAYAVEQRVLETALANRKSDSLPAVGHCHYCETTFDPANADYSRKLFCDSDCAQDYAREKRLRQLNTGR